MNQTIPASADPAAFRRPCDGQISVNGVSITQAVLPADGMMTTIPAHPVEACVAQLLAAIETGREFCIHSGTAPLATPDGGAFLQCETSGSTGRPKRVRRSHASWIRSFMVDRALWNITPQDRIAVFGPLNHSLALYGAVSAVHLGAQVDVFAAPRPDTRLQMLRAAMPSLLYATPAQLRQLAACRDADTGIPGTRHVLIGGGFLDKATRNAAGHLFPGATLHAFYGASETSFIAISDATTPPLSVGRAYPHVEIRIRDEQARDLPPDHPGEVWVQSPYLFEGYAQGTSAQTRWQNGFLTVGELGWLDPEGHLFLAGRGDRMFTVSDQNVFPELIERLLLEQPGVTHAAALPLPDAKRGAVPVCFLSAGPQGLDTDAVLAACRRQLTPQAAPRRAVVLTDWPTLPSGKTDLTALSHLLKAQT